jgi:hypothetical protein
VQVDGGAPGQNMAICARATGPGCPQRAPDGMARPAFPMVATNPVSDTDGAVICTDLTRRAGPSGPNRVTLTQGPGTSGYDPVRAARQRPARADHIDRLHPGKGPVGHGGGGGGMNFTSIWTRCPGSGFS